MLSSAMPEPFYSYFARVEPLLTIFGAIYAMLFTETYYKAYLPIATHGFVTLPAHPTSISTIKLLGNCYLLIAMISLAVIPTVQKANIPEIVKANIFRRFFFVLAVMDIAHIYWSMVALGPNLMYDLAQWNGLAWGNIGITTALFGGRMLWFAYDARQVRPKTA